MPSEERNCQNCAIGIVDRASDGTSMGVMCGGGVIEQRMEWEEARFTKCWRHLGNRRRTE
jgi:hypothetical protein